MTDRVSWGEYAYAGFWRRLLGILIDGLILSVIAGALTAAFAPAVVFDPVDPATLQPRAGAAAAVVGWSGVWWVLVIAYETAMLSTVGWTVGKRAVGVEVRGADGAILSVPRALGRALGKIVSSIPVYLGFLWAGWDPRKQAWHDKFVSSFVLKRAWLEPAGQMMASRRAEAAPQPTQAPTGHAWGIPTEPAPEAEPEPGPAVAEPEPEPEAAEREPEPETGTVERESEMAEWEREPEMAEWEPGAAEAEREPEMAEREPEPEAEVAPEHIPPDEPEAAVLPGAEPSILDRLDFESADGEEHGPEPAPEAEQAPEPEREREPEPEPHAPAAEAQPQPEGETELAPGHGAAGQAETPAQPASQPQPASAGGGRPSPPPADDANLVAIARSGIAAESAGWLEQVANQVDPRLDRVAPQWRSAPQAQAARACAFGLLLGYLARLYPHMAPDLSRVAEVHPSFSTLPAGSRLQTLQDLAGDPQRATAWIGPLIGVDDPGRLGRLFE